MEEFTPSVPPDGPEPLAAAEARERELERAREIARLLNSLDGRDPRLRVEAARQLGNLRAAPEALLRALEDPHSQVRTAAAEALAQGVEAEYLPDVTDGLLAAIDDANDRVASAAINALGRLKAEDCQDEIWECLDDPNPYVAGAAVLALGRLGCGDLVERLDDFLEAEHDFVRQRAAQAAALLGYSQAGPALLRNLKAGLQLPPHRRDIKLLGHTIQALAALNVQEAIPLLVEIAQGEVGLRSRATEALLMLQAESTIEVLARMLADPSTRLRKNLIHMAVRADYRPALPLIRALLQDPSAEIRQAALAAVRRLQDRPAAETVRNLAFHDPNPFLRAHAVTCLADLRRAEAVPDLLALAGDLNAIVRRAVAEGLGLLPDLTPGAGTALERLGRDPDPETAATAGAALERHAGQLPQASPAEAEPSLVPPGLRGEALPLLDSLRRWQARLPECVTADNLAAVGQVDAALAELIEALRHTGPDHDVDGNPVS